MKMHASEKWHL